MMKHLVILVLAVVLSGLSASAETIQGHVSDTKGEPMPFVTISVLAQDSSLITGAITGLPEGYTCWFKNTVRQQRVMLTVTWMFGQYQQLKNRKVGNMDELNRLGGGGGVSTGQ